MNFLKQWLILGGSSPEGEEANFVRVQIDLCTDEPMCPVPVHGECLAENFGLPLTAGASEKNDLASQWGLQIQLPVGRKRCPAGSGVPTGGTAIPGRCDVALRAPLQVVQTGMMEPLPDLRLPASVEAFDGGLKARFVGDGKHRGDFQVQAQSDHTSHRSGIPRRRPESALASSPT